MSLCLVLGTLAAPVAGDEFSLAWTHSVERTEWRERWRVEDAGDGAPGLALVEARVRGSGAGMDPGEGARLEDGWWVWTPALAAVPELVLAASGATGGGWTLCDLAGPDEPTDGARCRTIGRAAGTPASLVPCAGASDPSAG